MAAGYQRQLRSHPINLETNRAYPAREAERLGMVAAAWLERLDWSTAHVVVDAAWRRAEGRGLSADVSLLANRLRCRLSEENARFGRMIACHLQWGRFADSHLVIDQAQRQAAEPPMPLLELPLADVMHWTHATVLEEAGIEFVGDLLALRPGELLAVPRCGPRRVATIFRALAKLGLRAS